MKVIIITGTPGTGKTSLAQILKKKIGFEILDLKKIIKTENLCETYDKENQCQVIDIQKLKKILIKKIKDTNKDVIIESHFSHHLPANQVDLCIVTRTDIKTLNQRLKQRHYSKQKIRDNLDAEIFDLSLIEAQEKGHNILIVDTTKDIKKEEIIQQIKEKLKIK